MPRYLALIDSKGNQKIQRQIFANTDKSKINLGQIKLMGTYLLPGPSDVAVAFEAPDENTANSFANQKLRISSDVKVVLSSEQ